MACGALPFPSASLDQLIAAAAAGRYAPLPHGVAREVVEIVHGTLCVSPDDRLSGAELWALPWTARDSGHAGREEGAGAAPLMCGECDEESLPLLADPSPTQCRGGGGAGASRLLRLREAGSRLLCAPGWAGALRAGALRVAAVGLYAAICVFALWREERSSVMSKI
mmetsp:Transcript_8832/g.25995  ORF Transcript_8832/g.25995 Transcript_8832/m.25995 type:complete len:167 (-) Transcript_8832:119-619(-)